MFIPHDSIWRNHDNGIATVAYQPGCQYVVLWQFAVWREGKWCFGQPSYRKLAAGSWPGYWQISPEQLAELEEQLLRKSREGGINESISDMD